MRVALRVGVGLVAAVALVAVVVVLLFDTDAGRARVCQVLTESINETIRGSLRIGRCSAIEASHLRVEDVELRDPAGRVVLAFAAASMRADVDALSEGDTHVEELTIARPLVRLDERDGKLGLAAALEPRAPVAQAKKRASPLAIDRLTITDGRVEGLPQGVVASGLGIELGARWRPFLRVDLRSATVTLTRAGAPLAKLERARGVVDLSEDGASRLEAALTSGTDRATLTATTTWEGLAPGRTTAAIELTVSPDLLRRLGQAEVAARLVAPLRATVRVDGKAPDWTAQAHVVTAGGDVTLVGRRVGERSELRAATTRLELSRVIVDAAPGVAGGTIEATIRAGTTGTASPAPDHRAASPSPVTYEQRVDLRVEDARWDEASIPRATARAIVAADHVRIEELAIPHLTGATGRLGVQGRFGFDGAVEVNVDARVPDVTADPNVRRLAPDLRGGLEARITARRAAGETAVTVIEGGLTLERLAMTGFAAERLAVEGRIDGAWPVAARAGPPSPSAPARAEAASAGRATLALRARGRGLRSGGTVVPQVDLRVDGAAERPRVRGTLGFGRGRSAAIDLATTIGAETVALDGTAEVAGLWPRPLRVALRGVTVHPAHSVEARAVELEAGELRASAAGIVRFAGASSVTARAQGLDLAALDRALALDRGLAGTAAFDLRWEGTPRDPDVTLSATVEGGRLGDLAVSTARSTLRIDRAQRSLVAAADVGLARRGRIEARASTTLPRLSDLHAAAKAAHWDVRIGATELPASISPLLGAALGPDGRIDVGLRGQGTLAAPRVQAELAAWAPRRSAGAISLDGSFALDEAHALVTASASDPRGRVVSLELRLAAMLPHPLEVADATAFLALPWQLRVVVPERRIDQWPAQLRAEWPAKFRLDLTLRGGRGMTEGDLRASLVDASTAVRPASLAVEGALRSGRTTLTAEGVLAGRRALEASVEARTPIDQWLRGSAPIGDAADVPLEGTVRIDRAPVAALLAGLPGLREARGALDGSVRVAGRGADVRLDGTIALQGIAVAMAEPPLRIGGIDGRVRFSDGAIALEDVVTRDGDGRLRIDGRAVLDGLAPRRLDLRLRAERYPVRTGGLVAATVDGAVRGELELPADLGAPRVARVFVDALDVRLREPSTRPLQSLDANPDVVEVATRRRDPRPAPASGPPLRVELQASRPISIRRSDLGVQVGAALTIDVAGATRITGPVRLHRGFVDLIGRRFELQPTEVRFDGGAEASPEIDVAAVHRLATRGTVTARIHGRLPTPALAYSSTVPGVNSDLEIFELLGRDRGGTPSLRRSGAGALSFDLGLAPDFAASGTFAEPRAWSIDLSWEP